MVTHPTVIVGVGEAGINVLSRVHDIVEENEDGDKFEYIAIDADQDALNRAPTGTNTITLTLDDDWLTGDINRYPYLLDEMDIEGAGAKRQRPVGRYKVDRRGDRGYRFIFNSVSDWIETHYNEQDVNLTPDTASFNVFLIHSFGGGTGSGSYPLLISMLNQIVEDVLEEEDEVIYLAGVAAVPEIPFDTDVIDPPGRHSEYYPNAYAAYRDLEKFTDIEHLKGSEPLDINIWSRTAGRVSNGEIEEEDKYSFEHTTVPFDDYWLTGVDEGKIEGSVASTAGDEPFREMLNLTLANAIHGISKIDGSAEDWANDNAYTGTFAQAEIFVPHENVKALVEQQQERDDKQDQMDEEIPNTIDDLGNRKEELDDLKRGLDPGVRINDDEEKDLREEISSRLVESGFRGGEYTVNHKSTSEIETTLDEIDDGYTSDEIDDRLDEIDDRLDEIDDEYPSDEVDDWLDEIDDRLDEIDDDRIEALIIATEEIRDDLRDKRGADAVEAQWEETIQDIWERHRLQTMKEYGAGEVEDIEHKAIVIEEYLDEQMDELSDTIENWDPGLWGQIQDALPPVSIFESERENAEMWLEIMQDDYRALESARSDWDRVNEMIETIEQRRADIRGRIDDRMDHINQVISLLQNTEDELERKIRQIESKIDNIREDLTEEEYSERFAKLPIKEEKLDDIDEVTLDEELDCLHQYVENGYIDEQKYRVALNDRIGFAEAGNEDIIDRRMERTDRESPYDADDEMWILFNEKNSGYREYIEGGVPSDMESGSSGQLQFLPDPYRIKYISYTRRGPIRAFKTFQQYEELEEAGRLEDYADSYKDYRRAFAYMENYGPEIKEAFVKVRFATPMPPELDIDRINKPEMSQGKLKNWVKNPGLDTYLWQGKSGMEAYEPEEGEERFTGWKEQLPKRGMSYHDLLEATPDPERKSEWMDDQITWEELLQEYKENVREKHNVNIIFTEEE